MNNTLTIRGGNAEVASEREILQIATDVQQINEGNHTELNASQLRACTITHDLYGINILVILKYQEVNSKR